MQRKEPSAGLVHALGDEIRRAGQVCVLERIVILCIRHCAAIEPYVDEVQFALHRLAARRHEDDAVHIRTMQIDDRRIVVRLAIIAHFVLRPRVRFHEARLHRFLDFIEQFCDRTDTNFLFAVLGAPNRQRCTPITTTAQVPIVQVLQPFAETACSGALGLPIDGLVERNHLLARFGRLDEPAVQRIVQHGFVGSPTMRIRVHVLLSLEQTSVGFHLQA